MWNSRHVQQSGWCVCLNNLAKEEVDWTRAIIMWAIFNNYRHRTVATRIDKRMQRGGCAHIWPPHSDISIPSFSLAGGVDAPTLHWPALCTSWSGTPDQGGHQQAAEPTRGAPAAEHHGESFGWESFCLSTKWNEGIRSSVPASIWKIRCLGTFKMIKIIKRRIEKTFEWLGCGTGKTRSSMQSWLL